MEIQSLPFCTHEMTLSGLYPCPMHDERLEEYVPKQGLLSPFWTEEYISPVARALEEGIAYVLYGPCQSYPCDSETALVQQGTCCMTKLRSMSEHIARKMCVSANRLCDCACKMP